MESDLDCQHWVIAMPEQFFGMISLARLMA